MNTNGLVIKLVVPYMDFHILGPFQLGNDLTEFCIIKI